MYINALRLGVDSREYPVVPVSLATLGDSSSRAVDDEAAEGARAKARDQDERMLSKQMVCRSGVKDPPFGGSSGSV
jgi:hypothetical protein